MELKDFIKNTITELSDAVEELNKELPKGAAVNPTSQNGIKNIPSYDITSEYLNVTNIEFDLSLIAESSNSTNGKIGVAASIINMGRTKDEGDLSRYENRIRFSLPVILPSKKFDIVRDENS